LVCALRITFPQIGIILSTREPAPLRDAMAPLGITMMSAGSHTEPGGYTGQGADQIHQTVKGKKVEISVPVSACGSTSATEQFSISDDRTPAEVASMLQAQGLEPVWKDWDAAILTA
jgi:2-iminoacetate synthase